MPDAATLSDFHFLRPWWLLGVGVAVLLYWRLRHAYSAGEQWREVIAPELLERLTVTGRHAQRRRDCVDCRNCSSGEY